MRFYLLPLLLLSACDMNDNKPNPEQIPYVLNQHNDERIDNYYWMRDDTRSSEKVLSYLRDENAYTDQWFAARNNYKKDLFDELMLQVAEEETSFAVNNNGYKYYEKTKKLDQLSRFYRSDTNGEEFLILDPNIKLINQEYYDVKSITPSFDNSLIAISEDNNGRREYTIKIIDSELMTELDDLVENTTGTVIWTDNNEYILYLKKDPVTLISNSVYAHKIGQPSSADILLYREDDLEFNLSLSISKTKKYAFINIEATNLNEIRLIDINKPLADPILFMPRLENHLYFLEHHVDESFLVLSNKDAPNFKVLKSQLTNVNSIENMEILIDHDSNIFISNILISGQYLALEIRQNGLPEISVFNMENTQRHDILFPDNAYDVAFAYNNELDGNSFNYTYSSLKTVPSIINYDLTKFQSTKVWQKEIKGFIESNYVDQRFFIESRDGEMIPVITIAHKDTDIKNAPILFYGYGSYGINIDASFRSSLIPLLNRGFVFSIINIRGGGEMGKRWYENGRMFNKLNTFYDFNDGVKAVLNKGIGDSKNVFARGGSAGGLLMGGIINLEPELYSGILSGVPFVDVLTTMSDPSIPLTTFEYDEWGNPANKDEYFYMKQYSPYDNISNSNYPAVFITSSLFDSQVQYFEPAKYTAKLREMNTSKNPILMKMNLIGGHGGMSGRINQFEEISEEYSFLLNLIKK